MKKFFELITLAALSTEPYFTVYNNGEAMYELYKNILADLTEKASNTDKQKTKQYTKRKQTKMIYNYFLTLF